MRFKGSPDRARIRVRFGLCPKCLLKAVDGKDGYAIGEMGGSLIVDGQHKVQPRYAEIVWPARQGWGPNLFDPSGPPRRVPCNDVLAGRLRLRWDTFQALLGRARKSQA
jgi:hypothetical protein